jgi:hypothetical protein
MKKSCDDVLERWKQGGAEEVDFFFLLHALIELFFFFCEL